MASTRFGDNGVAIERLDVSAYTVPTDAPEADGTYTWDKTTMVLVEASAGGKRGLGYTYADGPYLPGGYGYRFTAGPGYYYGSRIYRAPRVGAFATAPWVDDTYGYYGYVAPY